jgi:hypothetical protein
MMIVREEQLLYYMAVLTIDGDFVHIQSMTGAYTRHSKTKEECNEQQQHEKRIKRRLIMLM